MMPQQMTVSDSVQSAIPQTVEEATPLEFYETLVGSSGGAATINVESTVLQLDSSFISKTLLKETTVMATKVTTAPVGSPQNQEKGAFASYDLESTPITKENTTTSGGNLDDPVKFGDELRYRELTARMSSFENIVGEMKDMMKQVLEASKSQPSHQQITQELWNSMQLILVAPRELAELQHNSHMELIKVMVEARYTHADIRGIKESFAKLTGSSPTPILEKEDQDDAKRGRKTQ
ncbi:hypothetical protein HanPI659440_Chr13g0501601 [Helianthus annuus]|nr:hypothetical protein HanPI659440_Chr13g0501601 [Helianthus annuus]